MKRAIVLLCAALMVACASPAPSPLATSPSKSGVIAAGTLAPLGSWEWQIAPAYTRNAMVRQGAAAALRDGRISVDTAGDVLRLTDRAREALDAARESGAQRDLDEALERIEAAAQLIEVRL